MLNADPPVTFFFGNMVKLFKRAEETVVVIMLTVTDFYMVWPVVSTGLKCTSIKITFDIVKSYFTASMNFIKNSACYPVNLSSPMKGIS